MRKENNATAHGHGNMRAEGEGSVPLGNLGYETDDVGVQTLAKWVVFLFAFVAGSLALTFFVYRVFVPGDDTQAEAYAQFPLTGQQRLPPADAPILQASPKQDWIDFNREENEKVHTYGWNNQSRGVVRVPIERAIDLIAERGLPVPRAKGPAAQAESAASSNRAAPGTGQGMTAQPGMAIGDGAPAQQ